MQGLIIGISRKRNCIIRVSFISIDINSECHSFLAKTILDIHLHLEMTEVLIFSFIIGILIEETKILINLSLLLFYWLSKML